MTPEEMATIKLLREKTIEECAGIAHPTPVSLEDSDSEWANGYHEGVVKYRQSIRSLLAVESIPQLTANRAWKDCPMCDGGGFFTRNMVQVQCPTCKAHFDAIEEACEPLLPNMLLKFAWCSIGRPGFIYGRKEMPWGMAWIGWGLDGKGDWSSRNPKEMTPFEVMKVIKKLSGNATEEDT